LSAVCVRCEVISRHWRRAPTGGERILSGSTNAVAFAPIPDVRGTAIELQGSTRSERCGAQEIGYYGADLSAARPGDRAYRPVLRSGQGSEIAGALVPSKGGF
jgi:hypothetical protein